MICGGSGHDRIYGGRGKDTLDGNKNADLVHGGRGSDDVDGGARPLPGLRRQRQRQGAGWTRESRRRSTAALATTTFDGGRGKHRRARRRDRAPTASTAARGARHRLLHKRRRSRSTVDLASGTVTGAEQEHLVRASRTCLTAPATDPGGLGISVGPAGRGGAGLEPRDHRRRKAPMPPTSASWQSRYVVLPLEAGQHACGSRAARVSSMLVSLGAGDDQSCSTLVPPGVAVAVDAGHGSDRLRGGPGGDTLYAGDDGEPDRLAGGGGDDALFGVNILHPQHPSGAATMVGGGGNDLLIGGQPCDGDRFHGGPGANDSASFARVRNEGIVVEAAIGGPRSTRTGPGCAAGRISRNIEKIEGSTGPDVLSALPRDDILLGRGGADPLDGRGGETAASAATPRTAPAAASTPATEVAARPWRPARAFSPANVMEEPAPMPAFSFFYADSDRKIAPALALVAYGDDACPARLLAGGGGDRAREVELGEAGSGRREDRRRRRTRRSCSAPTRSDRRTRSPASKDERPRRCAPREAAAEEDGAGGQAGRTRPGRRRTARSAGTARSAPRPF